MKVVFASVLAVCAIALGVIALWNKRQPAADSDSPSTVVAAPRFHSKTSGGTPQTAGLVVHRRDAVSDPYRVLLSRCIFSPHRGVSVAPDASASQSAAAAAMELSGLSLRGTSQEDSRFTAYVEDTTNHRMIEVRSGDALGGGHVGDISLHDMEFLASGLSVRIEVGQTLSGVASAPIEVVASADKPASAAPPPTDVAPPKKKKNRHAE